MLARRSTTPLLLVVALLAAVGCAPDPSTAERVTLDPGGKGDGADPTAEAERFERWANLIRAVGGEVNPGGRVSVLGLRGRSLDGSWHDTYAVPDHDDTFLVLRPDGSLVEVAGSTHPFVSVSSAATDADGDGTGDVGMIRPVRGSLAHDPAAPGHYVAVARPPARNIADRPTYAIRTADDRGGLPGWRDTDHDGLYSDEERAASETRGDRLTAVLFHQSGPGAPAAIGCQVFPAEGMARLVEAVGGADAIFDYILMDRESLPEGYE